MASSLLQNKNTDKILTFCFFIVTKPTVEVLSKADVEVTVGMCQWL